MKIQIRTSSRLCKGVKLTRCPNCYRLLCKRIPMHNKTEQVYGFHIKHRGLEIITAQVEAVFTCPACHNKVLISSENGVVGR